MILGDTCRSRSRSRLDRHSPDSLPWCVSVFSESPETDPPGPSSRMFACRKSPPSAGFSSAFGRFQKISHGAAGDDVTHSPLTFAAHREFRQLDSGLYVALAPHLPEQQISFGDAPSESALQQGAARMSRPCRPGAILTWRWPGLISRSADCGLPESQPRLNVCALGCPARQPARRVLR
jgi:hypothetical protein